MQISGRVSFEIDNRQEAEIFHRFLGTLRDGLWVVEKTERGEKRGIYRTIDMEGRGSDIDELVTDNVDDPKYAVHVAAWRLHVALMKAREAELGPKRKVQDTIATAIHRLSRLRTEETAVVQTIEELKLLLAVEHRR